MIGRPLLPSARVLAASLTVVLSLGQVTGIGRAFAESGSGARDEFFDSSGVRIHYTDKGDGEPIILIHGFAMSIARWEASSVIDSLTEGGYRVIAIDCRGHGESGKPHDPEQYGEEIAKDIIRLLDHLDLDKAHVVGYSMGAIITNKVRQLHPERLQTAVLGGAGWMEKGGSALPGLDGSDLADALERTGDFKWMLREFTKNRQPPATEEEIEERNRRMMVGNDPSALAAVLRAWDGFAVPESDLRNNKVPTLSLIGANDPLKERVDALARVMSQLEIVVIPDADHGRALSDPAFTKNIKRFLAQHTLSEGAR